MGAAEAGANAEEDEEEDEAPDDTYLCAKMHLVDLAGEAGQGIHFWLLWAPLPPPSSTAGPSS